MQVQAAHLLSSEALESRAVGEMGAIQFDCLQRYTYELQITTSLL